MLAAGGAVKRCKTNADCWKIVSQNGVTMQQLKTRAADAAKKARVNPRSIKEWKALGDGNLHKIRRLGDNALPVEEGGDSAPGGGMKGRSLERKAVKQTTTQTEEEDEGLDEEDEGDETDREDEAAIPSSQEGIAVEKRRSGGKGNATHAAGASCAAAVRKGSTKTTNIDSNVAVHTEALQEGRSGAEKASRPQRVEIHADKSVNKRGGVTARGQRGKLSQTHDESPHKQVRTEMQIAKRLSFVGQRLNISTV